MSLSLWPLWGLVFARAAGLLALAPPTGWRHFPPVLRLAAAAVLALPLTLAVLPDQPQVLALPVYAAAVLREAAVGLLMGAGLWLLVWGAFAAGHLQDVMSGLGAADDEEGGPLANLFAVVAVVFFVQLNGLHWLVAFFRQSFALLPPGHEASLVGAGGWVYWPALFFAGLLQLAAPVVLATVLAGLLVGSLQRVLPDLRASETLPAVRALMTLLALALVAPLLGAVLLGQINTVAEATARWLMGLG